MREILPPMSAAKKLCRDATFRAGDYRTALHVLRVPCEEGVLCYHTLTGALLLLSPEEAAEPKVALRRELIRRRFLVPTDFDEAGYARQIRHVAELMAPRKSGITSFTIFTTTDCNARCAYCYELGRPRRPMSDTVARDAAAYIDSVREGNKVKLSWFGGEPLYHRRAIDLITAQLRARGVPFESGMVTNGYLFDEETVRTAREEWALKWVQITLDGTEEIYNKTKAFVHREGSAYQRVLHNIGLLLNAGVEVRIRLNTNQQNVEDQHALVEELSQRFCGLNRPKVYSVLLRDFGPLASHPEAEAEALSAWNSLQRRIMDSGMNGLRYLPRSVQANGCMADNDNSVTILPDGRLGKCEHESEELFIGSIYDQKVESEMVQHWKARVEVPECRSCTFAPACIRLRLCAWTGDACTQADRERIRLSVSQMVLNEYRRSCKAGRRKEE